MKPYYFLLLIAYLPFTGLIAQNYEILDPNLQVKNFKFEQEVYIPEMGTKGVMFIFEYYYTTPSKYLVTFPQEIAAYKYGIEVFKDTSTYLVMRPNQWNKARKFIPYRAIDVPEGEHKDLEVKYQVEGVINFNGIMQFTQPARYAIRLALKKGSTKPKAGSYDPGQAPQEAAADLYWTVTSNEGMFPAYTSQVSKNASNVKAEEANFYVLEGEKLYLNFYDEDPEEDLKLGSTVLVEEVNVDFKTEQFGRMFGNMRGVNYEIGQRKMIRQPISTYVRKDFEYKGRKGVKVIFDYFLPQALEGSSMKPIVQYKTKDGKSVKIPFFYAMNESPNPGQEIQLQQQGNIAYFIPHYAWNSAVHTIEFAFEGSGDRAEAAPYFIHQAIEFGKYISYTGYYIEDNYKYLGTSGIKLSISYKMRELHQYSDLELNFLDESGAPLNFGIYAIEEEAKDVKALPSNPYTLRAIEEEDTLEYFIPFIDLDAKKIRLEANLIPDMVIPLIHESSPLLQIPTTTKDAVNEKVAEGNLFQAGDYGFVMELKCRVPSFYKGRAILDIKAKRNNIHFDGFSAVGDMIEQQAIDTFKVVQDTGTIYIIFPHRRLTAKDKISVECKLVDYSTGRTISEVAKAEQELPPNLYNIDTEFLLKFLEFMPEIKADEDDNSVGWKLMLTVGSETKISKTLEKKVKGKAMTSKYSRTVRVNREDLIQIKVVNKQNEEDVVYLWSGDLGKFLQNKFKNTVVDQGPIKKAKVQAKAPKKLLKN